MSHQQLRSCGDEAKAYSHPTDLRSQRSNLKWHRAADLGVAISVPAHTHTFVEIDHGIISKAILLPSADSRRAVVSYKRKYVHKVLANCLVKFAKEKV